MRITVVPERERWAPGGPNQPGNVPETCQWPGRQKTGHRSCRQQLTCQRSSRTHAKIWQRCRDPAGVADFL